MEPITINDVYDAVIFGLCLVAGVAALWYWRYRPRSPAYSFRMSILINIILFTGVRTLALTTGLVEAPTYFFSAWGAVIMAQMVFTIVYTAKIS